jgi:hypothetical protein
MYWTDTMFEEDTLGATRRWTVRRAGIRKDE